MLFGCNKEYPVAKQDNRVEQLYALIANEEDARACRDIPQAACREVPQNFFLMLASLVLTKLGDLLISPKTVLPWLMGAIGAPSTLVAWLVPIRESGSLIPQLAIGAWMRRHALRKGFWVAGSIAQGVAVLAMAMSVWWLEGLTAGLAIIGFLVLFSLARGFCSLALKDVQGKTIPKQRRGRLSGLATTLAGTATVVITALLFYGNDDAGKGFYTALLIMAAILWGLAALSFSRIEEIPGATDGGENALGQAFGNLRLLLDDVTFRHFVIARSLLLCSALASPFFVLLAQRQSDTPWLLAAFVLGSSLAGSLSATVWGYMADASSRQVMIRGAFIASAVCLFTGSVALLGDDSHLSIAFYPLAFFALSIAHAGVRIGRKTYLVDMAAGNQRTDYVAVSNTVIGVVLLLAGALGALASLVSVAAVIMMLGVMGAAGVVMAWRLPEVENP
ncbi:MAG: MFS transporter [Halomonadaceae bacterium]|nr:MAG: MFS transporter [Halomonadaceae bacterium]